MRKDTSSRERLALGLLVGQTLFYGAAQSAMAVVTYTLFLDTFGAQMLPYGYLVTALSISMVFYGLTWLQQKMALTRALATVMYGLAGLVTVLWLLLQQGNVRWIAFALLPLTTFVFQWGFILPGLQVSNIFNVRQVKRLYPIVNAGLTIGFILGSFGAPLIVALTGSLASAMAGAVIMMLITLVLLLITVVVFKARFAQPSMNREQRPRKSLGQLLRNRYIRLIVAVQMLTTVVWHIVEFMYLAQSEARYPKVEDLATFIGQFGAARNIAAVLVMVFVAGHLVNRYGLKLGLLIGPIGVGAGVLAIMGSGLIGGMGSAILFWIIIATFGLHMVLEEGFTIPAQKTSYQLLPKDERQATETMVEGIGMSLAVGLSGLILLAFNAMPALTILHVAGLALAISTLWTGIALFLTKDYARLLLNKLRRRVLDEGTLTLSDGFDQTLIADFMQSGDLGKVRLALNVLENRYEPGLQNYLLALTDDPKPEIRIEGLQRIESLQIRAAVPHIQRRLNAETKPEVKGAALRTLGAVAKADAVEQLLEYMDSPRPKEQQGAIVGLLKHGGAAGSAAANQRLIQLAQDGNAGSRALAAQIIGDAGVAEHYLPLRALLRDSQMTTRHYALDAAARLKHDELLPDLIESLAKNPDSRPLVSRSLGQYGAALLPTVAAALEQTRTESTILDGAAGDGLTYSVETVCSLIKICGQIKGDDVCTLLLKHLEHPNLAIQKQILAALSSCDYQVNSEEVRTKVEGVLAKFVGRALYSLVAKEEIGLHGESDLLTAALEQAAIDARHQVFYLLSFLYNPQAMRRADEQIAYGPAPVRAFATEMLDVTLTSQHKNMVWPLIDDKIVSGKRTQHLSTDVPIVELSRHERLSQLLDSPDVENKRWIQSCALFTIGQERLLEHSQSVQRMLASPDPIQQETAAWAAHRLQRTATHSDSVQRSSDNSTMDSAQMDVDEDRVATSHIAARDYMYLTLEKVALLKEVDIFAETPDHILASVAAIVEQIDIEAGETFIQQGDIGDCMYLIIDGEVLVHQGDDEILTLGPGKSVGELAILDLSPRETSVTTTEPTQLFRIDKDAFDEVLSERPEIARSVIRALSQRVRMTTAARQSGEDE